MSRDLGINNEGLVPDETSSTNVAQQHERSDASSSPLNDARQQEQGEAEYVPLPPSRSAIDSINSTRKNTFLISPQNSSLTSPAPAVVNNGGDEAGHERNEIRADSTKTEGQNYTDNDFLYVNLSNEESDTASRGIHYGDPSSPSSPTTGVGAVGGERRRRGSSGISSKRVQSMPRVSSSKLNLNVSPYIFDHEDVNNQVRECVAAEQQAIKMSTTSPSSRHSSISGGRSPIVGEFRRKLYTNESSSGMFGGGSRSMVDTTTTGHFRQNQNSIDEGGSAASHRKFSPSRSSPNVSPSFYTNRSSKNFNNSGEKYQARKRWSPTFEDDEQNSTDAVENDIHQQNGRDPRKWIQESTSHRDSQNYLNKRGTERTHENSTKGAGVVMKDDVGDIILDNGGEEDDFEEEEEYNSRSLCARYANFLKKVSNCMNLPSFRLAMKILLILAFHAYLIGAIYFHYKNNLPILWCDGFGIIIILTGLIYVHVFIDRISRLIDRLISSEKSVARLCDTFNETYDQVYSLY